MFPLGEGGGVMGNRKGPWVKSSKLESGPDAVSAHIQTGLALLKNWKVMKRY